MTFYNDHYPFVCQWTRNLIAADHITTGTVDERPIEQITPADLARFERVHLFSGLAGWEAALNLAGWHGPVWTCSCPCQAFSCAGKGGGFAEDRGNLWFHVLRLVRECRPVVIVGEQVPAAIRHGWLDRVFTDLEAEGYACGSCVLGAHSIGAPHRRQRIYWVAIAQGSEPANGTEHSRRRRNGFTNGSSTNRMADTEHGRNTRSQTERRETGHISEGMPEWMGHANDTRPQGRRIYTGEHPNQQSLWSASQLIQCADGKARRIPLEPAFQPLVATGAGAGNRVGILRSSGNTLCVPLAAEFVRCVMELRVERTRNALSRRAPVAQ